MATIRYAVCALVAGLVLSQAPVVFAQKENAQDLLLQQEKQKQIQAETDQVVRRLSTMMRVMQFYGADKEAEAELLGEMRQTLAGLSKNQMTEVMRRLEEAAKAADAKK